MRLLMLVQFKRAQNTAQIEPLVPQGTALSAIPGKNGFSYVKAQSM